MHPIHAIRRPADILSWLASILLAFIIAAPAAIASTPPGWAWLLSWANPLLPPGWNKHPPLPAHLHPLVTGGIPGWQLTLMAVTAVLLAATSVAIGNPRPGGTPAGERTHRRNDDRKRRQADPRGQPPGERPHPASRPGRNGFAGRFIQDIAAVTSVAIGQNQPAPPATMPRRHTMIAARLRPRTVQLCIHCRQNPAGFWVSHTSDQTVRRPWCLSCCQGLDQSRYHVIPFDGHEGAGRFQCHSYSSDPRRPSSPGSGPADKLGSPQSPRALTQQHNAGRGNP
jgi:hypothetical protein